MTLPIPPIADEQTLLDACRRGEAAAWAELVKKYERLVMSIPLRFGLSRVEADDIFQLTFTYLLQNLDGIRDATRLSSWLATVSRRQTWLFVQRSRREMPVLDEMEDSELSADAAVLSESKIDRIDRWELSFWLDQGLSKLSQRCQELLLALYFETDKPIYTEISAKLDIPVGSIGPTRGRCLERLKELLGDA
jgi:RNA polymerase sigma factor (sigma-70 family)